MRCRSCSESSATIVNTCCNGDRALHRVTSRVRRTGQDDLMPVKKGTMDELISSLGTAVR